MLDMRGLQPTNSARQESATSLYTMYETTTVFDLLQKHGGYPQTITYLKNLGLFLPEQPRPKNQLWEVKTRSISQVNEFPTKLPHSGAYDWIGIPNTDPPKWLWDSQEYRTVRANESHFCEGYIAVSYTWGRWSVENRQIQTFGTPWPLPILEGCDLHHDELKRLLNQLPGARYFWVDVLCINQNDKEETKSEISKQGTIFASAKGVIVYLWNIANGDELGYALCDLGDFILFGMMLSKYGEGSTFDSQTEERDSKEMARKLRSDPWFSSLWTLQEMILTPSSVWMARNGDTCYVNEKICTTTFVATALLLVETMGRLRYQYETE